ncbi:protein YqbG [Chengkuizengella axinellae]|uniref:DUF3199 family protein n=1 Tax=Chengkuizengella axinellae TaxID=3064388 RepID=A0ABT9IW00_9BACL|nr:DUF3199 family protein [Chengkuizengella sp. 2205SS18-9]MDP5273544.1 DUF3199 family protein [Chengkuizengella sp. 2205SS18-9]
MKNRTDLQIEFDLIQAETEIYRYVGHQFTEFENDLPDKIKLAFIKITEYYALINSDEGVIKGYQSESIGDYSYTIGMNPNQFSVTEFLKLLDEYVQEGG